MGDSILNFVLAFDLTIVNTYFEEKDVHLVQLKSGFNRTKNKLLLLRCCLASLNIGSI